MKNSIILKISEFIQGEADAVRIYSEALDKMSSTLKMSYDYIRTNDTDSPLINILNSVTLETNTIADYRTFLDSLRYIEEKDEWLSCLTEVLSDITNEEKLHLNLFLSIFSDINKPLETREFNLDLIQNIFRDIISDEMRHIGEFTHILLRIVKSDKLYSEGFQEVNEICNK